MRRLIAIILCLLTGPILAQDDDRGSLTAFLEDTLSDAGREVTITGFAGALSSRASIDSLTIADDDGVWLTLNGVVLDWTQSSLLLGELDVSELSAAEVILARLPNGGSQALPSPEAAGFQLPDLPVSISIDTVKAARIEVGQAVFGQTVSGTLAASMALAEGAGSVELELRRTDDGPQGQIVFAGSFDNATRKLSLDLDAQEGTGGIVAGLLGIPGTPETSLALRGNGAIDDFRADLRLATEDEDRLAGTLTIGSLSDAGHRLALDVSGNLAPLIAPDYAEFFGNDIGLLADATYSGAGRLVVDTFELKTRTARLSGSIEVAPDGLPDRFALTGSIASPDGQPVLLPIGDIPARVQTASLSVQSANGSEDGWLAKVEILGLERNDVTVSTLRLSGSGRIGRTAAGKSFGGTLAFLADGLLPADPNLAMAIGPQVSGALTFHSLEGSKALSLTNLRLEGSGLSATGALDIEGWDQAFLTRGDVMLSSQDFSRFSGLAGQDLKGAGALTLSGSASGLSGVVDLEVGFDGTGLGMGQPAIDRMLSGQSTLRGSVKRDETGTELRALSFRTAGLVASASGKLASSGSELQASLALADLSVLDPTYAGAIDLEAAFNGTLDDGRLLVMGQGKSLLLGNAEIEKLLAGQTDFQANLVLVDGQARIDQLSAENARVSVKAVGDTAASAPELSLEARLADIGLFVPGLSGPLSLRGNATTDNGRHALVLDASGPGGVNASIRGEVADSLDQANLDIRGSGAAGLANLFLSPRSVSGAVSYDLRLDGPISLASLSGRVSLSDGRIVDPGLGLAFGGVEGLAEINRGRAQVSATATVSTGGRVRIDGPISLSSPYAAQISVILEGLVLKNPELYTTVVSGSVDLTGPLSGGARLAGNLSLSDTEIRVTSSGFTSADALLDITHIHEPVSVRRTRRYAGLLDHAETTPGGGSSGAGGVRLDILLSAPGKVFVRGRGIDAELGGSLRLTGDTGNIVPSGAFRLIRGRMDILGKRLVLSQADLQLEGSLVPQIEVSASTENDGIVSIVTLEGPADDPEVVFSSIPELPQEEVLAQLLFGRGLAKISAFQAAQLANAVAVLAGRRGEGIVSKLRRKFGLDDLDVVTTEDGSTTLKAGKYISENVYSEVEVDQDGRSQINLNLDLRGGLTVKGQLGADGETGVGIYLERDY